MNWTKAILAAVVAGIATAIANFVCHGLILGNTYVEHDQVFSQEQGNPIWFFLLSIIIALVVAILFGKTRNCWPNGIVGGVQCGFLIGLVVGITSFFWPIIFDGFPPFLAWCWLGIDVIGYSLLGLVLALFLKPTDAPAG